MLSNLNPGMLSRMAELEAIDRRDRWDGTPLDQRLRQIPAETGRTLTLLAATASRGRILEIGTSAGYSTMWLALAARETGRVVRTFEVLPDKVALARETFRQSGIGDCVEQVHGDAREYLEALDGVGFCFMDLEKDLYAPCYDLVVPNMLPGALLVADNAISHEPELGPFLKAVKSDERVDSVIFPVGKGLLICRRMGQVP